MAKPKNEKIEIGSLRFEINGPIPFIVATRKAIKEIVATNGGKIEKDSLCEVGQVIIAKGPLPILEKIQSALKENQLPAGQLQRT